MLHDWFCQFAHNSLELAREDAGGFSDAERLEKFLDELKTADQGAVVCYKTDDQNQLDEVFFCTSGMIETYRSFPEVVFFDGTYKYVN